MIKRFYKPESVAEALRLKRQYGAKARWFGGGTWINNSLGAVDCERAISVEKLGLDRIERTSGRLSLGAAATLQQMIDSPEVWPVLQQAARFLWSRNLRNMATIGGHIALGHRSSGLIPCLLALGAELETTSNECIALEEYVREQQNDLILKVRVPSVRGVCQVARVARQAKGPTIITAAVHVIRTAGRIEKARVVLGGVGEQVLQLAIVERKLEEGPDIEKKVLEAAVAEAIAPAAPTAYQSYIGSVTIADLVEACQEEKKAYEN
ncbi:MAG: hypothetical protein EHM45_17500 [Desulfobacteraceae bacterium]|nr:MAG: hypothetical protein EHM45_17500 [Desulfobacteraceae bacterium]